MNDTRHGLDAVPVVDIAELERPRVRAAIDQACRDWGFFQVTGHGIDDSVLGGLFDAAQSFFALPVESKRLILRTEDNPWGYYDRELTKQTLDWKQVFDFGPADGDKLLPRWPDGLPGFEPAVRAFYDGCEGLAMRLLGVVASNLGMPGDALDAHFDRGHTSFLRLNFYPRYTGDTPTSETFGVNHHTDAGVLTLLLQDDQPGLEVFRDGRWYLVEPVPGALVINIGDIVQVWSNDRYRAALHRVVTNPQRDRYSAPYFFNPSYDTDYAPLPSLVDDAHPARYRTINWHEFRNSRHAGDYADYGSEVQISDYRIR